MSTETEHSRAGRVVAEAVKLRSLPGRGPDWEQQRQRLFDAVDAYEPPLSGGTLTQVTERLDGFFYATVDRGMERRSGCFTTRFAADEWIGGLT